MSNISKLSIILLLGYLFTANVNAQSTTGDIVVGGGLGFGLDIEEVGLNLNGYYAITDEIRAGVDILYYFGGDDAFGGSITFWELNFLGNYLFINDEDMRIYALAGIHRFNVSVSNGGFGFSGSQTGLIIGGGIEYDLGTVSIYGEPKLSLISAWGQLSLTAGVRYKF